MDAFDRVLAPVVAEAAGLADGEAAVWLADSAQVLAAVDGPMRLLSAAERARSDGFVFAVDRRMFVAAHVLARFAAAGAAGLPAAAVELAAAAGGRPLLRGPRGPLGVDLSLSHSGGMVAVALARGGLCGVDLESHRRSGALAALTGLACSPRERAWLDALDEGARTEAFHVLWTVKEAVLKGIGVGIAEPPARLSLEPGWPACRRLVADSRIAALARGWRIWRGRPQPALSLALALCRKRGGALRPRFRQLGVPGGLAGMHSDDIAVVMAATAAEPRPAMRVS